MKAYRGSRTWAPLIRNLGHVDMNGEHQGPTTFPREKNQSIYWIGGWMDPRACLKGSEKRNISCPCQDSKSGPSSPLPNSYTDGNYTPAPGN